jgi:collagenase-like PrtC family protease
MTKRLFSLPYTSGISDVIDELPVNQIDDIYFSDNVFGSARALTLESESLKELKSIREKHGIKLHYLVNGNHYTNEFYENLDDLIQHVKELDVDIITLNNTYIMKDVVFMDTLRKCTGRHLEIKNSVNNKPKTLKEVIFLVEVLSIRHIVVDRALNRNLDELKKISEYCKERDIKITMLVNEGCIVDCMWKNFDDMMISQTTEKSNMKVIQFVHNSLGCVDHFEKNTGEYLKTGFTLPNDLRKFDGLVDIIKLAGRGNPIDKWMTMCRAYMFEDGNVPIRYLFSTKPPLQLMNTTSNELASFNFNKITNNCKNVCGTECVLCDNVMSKMFPKNN